MEVEQKPFTRKRPQQLVYLELGSGNGGMLLSVSEEGFRFRAVSPVRADGPLPFAFSLDGINRLEGSGEIESLEDDGKSGGLRFTEVSDEFRGKLASWLSTDSSTQFTGREVTPAAAVPLDTIEKIREDIRASNPSPPRQSQPVAPPSNPVSTEIAASSPINVVRKAEPSPVPKSNEIPLVAPPARRSEGPAVNLQNRNATPEKALRPMSAPEKKTPPTIADRRFPAQANQDRAQADRNAGAENDSNRMAVERPRAERTPAEKPAAQPTISKVLAAKPPATGQPAANKSVADRTSAERPLGERIISGQKSMPVFSERLPEPQASPNTASRLLPQPEQGAPETIRPTALPSAFLKLARETKAPAGSPAPPAAPVGSVTTAAPRSSLPSTPPSRPVIPAANKSSDDSPLTLQPRGFAPALDVSMDMAWENAKLSAPSEPPHLSRAAAGGIIFVALAVILGALVFNFRQEIGAVFIQMGQRISGEYSGTGSDSSQPAQANPENQPTDGTNTPQTSAPPEARPQSTPKIPDNAGKTSSASAKTSTAHAPPGETSAVKSGVITSDNARSADTTEVPDAAKTGDKPAEISSGESPADNAAKPTAPSDAATGQEEFTAAREILHGKYRAQELSRAVELLWSAVKKGNVPAEVTLGDLYRRGDGVVKSCDQARVLLVAASKKGSADARMQLEQMAEQGCE